VDEPAVAEPAAIRASGNTTAAAASSAAAKAARIRLKTIERYACKVFMSILLFERVLDDLGRMLGAVDV
jgi:hypothetical protein